MGNTTKYTLFREPYTLHYKWEKGDKHLHCKSTIMLPVKEWIPKAMLPLYFKWQIWEFITVEKEENKV